jgi:DNA-binding IclR family transcriptional regulator
MYYFIAPGSNGALRPTRTNPFKPMPRKAAQPPVSEERAAPGGVASVDRALSLMDSFTITSPLLTLSELAERTKQYKSTVLRLLASLEYAHLVRRHSDGRFGLGSAIARLSAVYATSFSVADVVMPALRELVELTRESAAFHVRQGDQDLCLYRIDSPHPVRDHASAGDLQPLHLGAGGMVMAAFGGATGTRHARIRREKLLVADGLFEPEVAGIAAPVFGADGTLAGVLVLTMPSTRLRAGHGEVVRGLAQRLSGQLGGPAEPPAPAPRRKAVTAAPIRGNPR